MSVKLEDLTRFRFEEILNEDFLSSSFSYKSNNILATIDNNSINCVVRENIFNAKLQRNRFSDNNIILIICNKNNDKILDHTLDKLVSYNTQLICDILVVDDRSNNNKILEISDKYKTSYLRIDNSDNIFNYSVINNIAACYAKILKKDKIIFYNNDVWPDNEKTIPSLISKHDINNSNISGCKLVYPSKAKYDLLADNTHLLIDYIDIIVNTIQHGGIYFSLEHGVLKPFHLWRFYKPNKNLASDDRMCYAVTGAFHLVNTSSFFDIQGFTEGLSSSFQDIDLCIKAIEKEMRVFYFGSEFLYHAESLTVCKDKIPETEQSASDNILWNYLWKNKLPHIIGYQHA